MKKLAFLMLISLSVLAQQPAASQQSSVPKFAIAAGSSSGTYETMLAQLKNVCPIDRLGLDIETVESHGAIDNLAKVLDNEANGAFLHSDVIFYHDQTEPIRDRVKTLIDLYPEEVHIVALRHSVTQTAGTKIGGFNKQVIEFYDLNSLRGFKVGAAGGGVITADVIAANIGENNQPGFQVVDLEKGDSVLPALLSGQVQAVIFVGGSPLKIITDMDPNTYKLLPVPDYMIDRLKATGIYKPATIFYNKLDKTHIKTIAADAILVSRAYKTPKMVNALAQFRKCFHENLEELKETRGNHAKWSVVDPNSHGKWPWLDLPGDDKYSPPDDGTLSTPVTPTKKRR